MLDNITSDGSSEDNTLPGIIKSSIPALPAVPVIAPTRTSRRAVSAKPTVRLQSTHPSKSSLITDSRVTLKSLGASYVSSVPSEESLPPLPTSISRAATLKSVAEKTSLPNLRSSEVRRAATKSKTSSRGSLLTTKKHTASQNTIKTISETVALPLAPPDSDSIRFASVQNLQSCLDGTTDTIVTSFDNPNTVKYLAVSYKWKPEESYQMTVCVDYDGRTWTSKSAPKRVLVAIVDLCNQLSITKVWMDSLGIDQSCDENGTSTERSKLDKMHFIPKMTQVFSKAEIVAGYADSNESDACTEWYDRVWILQEMVLAKTLMIFRGKWQTVTEEKRFWAKKVATETIQEERKNGRSSHPGLRILSDLGAACLGTCQGETKLSLAQIAHLTSHRQCFMPQDRVYGVLGLLPFRSNLVTDYQEPLEVVWRKVILEAIEHSMDLSVFLTRRSQYQTDASICLGAMEVPEIAHGLSIMTWAAKQVIHNDTQWGFNKFFPATTVSIHKLENGLNCTSSLTNYVKAMLFLLTAIPKIGDKMNPNIAAKLDWICSTFFILNRVQDDREWGWEVVIRCAEVGASSDQASSSLEKDGKQPPNSNSVTLLVPSKELALTVGQNVVLIPVGHQGSTQRGIICKKSEETAGSGALVPVCVFSCDRAQLKRFPVVKGDLFFH